MRRHLLIVTASALMISGTATAEPIKLPAPRPAINAPVILASADQVVGKSPLPAQAEAAPVKRPRTARVTTCRCGSGPQAQAQEQP